MQRLIVKFAFFLKSKSFLKYLVCALFLTAFFIGFAVLLYSIYNEDIFETIFAAAFGFSASNILIYILGSFSRYFEDSIKVNTNTADMLNIYTPEYKKTVSFADSSVDLCYHELIVHRTGFSYEVEDDPDKFFELDDFFTENLVTLFDTHSSSKKNNELTVRMDDVKQNGKLFTFCLSRSTFFNHLITNRAVDFQISKDLSIRSFYEFGPEISPLNKSKLSNHVGINALVYLEDGSVLLQQRNKNATISKNCLTASIATRLTFPGGKPCKITSDYLMKGCLYDYLQIRLALDIQKVKKENVKIAFLGLGQNIYEGGKPQMYFRIDLKGVRRDNYHKMLLHGFTGFSKIDVDKKTHIVDPSGIRTARGGAFTVPSYNVKKRRYVEKTFAFERSLLCNFWHIQQN